MGAKSYFLGFLLLTGFVGACTSLDTKPRNLASDEKAAMDLTYAQKLAFFYSDGSYSYLNYIMRSAIRFPEDNTEIYYFNPKDSRLKDDRDSHPGLTAALPIYHETIVRYRFQLEKALQIMGQKKWDKVYRGTSLHDNEGKYKTGEIVREPSFLSTSQVLTGAEKFVSIAKQAGKADLSLWIYHDALGTTLNGHSFSPDEDEVLLPPWTVLRINQVIPPGQKTSLGPKEYWIFDATVVPEAKLSASEKAQLNKKDHLRNKELVSKFYGEDIDNPAAPPLKLGTAKKRAAAIQQGPGLMTPIDYDFLRY